MSAQTFIPSFGPNLANVASTVPMRTSRARRFKNPRCAAGLRQGDASPRMALKTRGTFRSTGGEMNLKSLASITFSTLYLVGSGFAQDRTLAPQSAPPAIGLAVGTRAPSFSLPDQSGRVQTNANPKGAKGTVLLFFRS